MVCSVGEKGASSAFSKNHKQKHTDCHKNHWYEPHFPWFKTLHLNKYHSYVFHNIFLFIKLIHVKIKISANWFIVLYPSWNCWVSLVKLLSVPVERNAKCQCPGIILYNFTGMLRNCYFCKSTLKKTSIPGYKLQRFKETAKRLNSKFTIICGSSSGVEHQLPKLRVGSSNLLSRSSLSGA